MLYIVSFECASLRVTEDISKDLKIGVGEDSRVQGSRMRNAVPPPITEDLHEGGTGRGLLMRVKP